MAQNRTMQQKNLINRKRQMKASREKRWDIMCQEYRDHQEYLVEEGEWVLSRPKRYERGFSSLTMKPGKYAHLQKKHKYNIPTLGVVRDEESCYEFIFK